MYDSVFNSPKYRLDDVESFQLSALPEHLVSMITILLEEERSANEEGQRTFQPCLEFLMQNRIMETLGLLGEKNVIIKDLYLTL
jgi:hypothetical protein